MKLVKDFVLKKVLDMTNEDNMFAKVVVEAPCIRPQRFSIPRQLGCCSSCAVFDDGCFGTR